MLIIFLIGPVSVAISQPTDIKYIADSLMKSSNNVNDTIFIKNYIQRYRPGTADRLALETVLINKYQELQLWDICFNYCYTQIGISQKTNNTLAEATFNNLLGTGFYHYHDKKKALQYWRKCIEKSEANGYYNLLSICYRNIAIANMEDSSSNQNCLSRTEDYLLKSIEFAKRGNIENTKDGRENYRLLATCYELLNNNKPAEKIYKEIITKSETAKDTANLLEALSFYGKLLHKQKQIEQAFRINDRALEIAKKYNRLDAVATVASIYKTILYTSSKYKKAAEMAILENDVNRQRFQTDLSNKISQAEAKYRYDELRHEKELVLLSEKKQKQFIILTALGLLIITTLIAYIISQRRETRQKLLLQQEKIFAEEKILIAEEKERQRISRDLHDNMGAYTSALLANLQNAKNQNLSDQLLDNMENNANQILTSLRETIWMLNNKEISINDLSDTFKDHCVKILQNFDDIEFEADEDIQNNKVLPAARAIHLYKILQESFQNILKHAKAKHIQFKIRSGERLKIILSDNGTGFDTNKIYNGNGLDNLKWRAAEAHFELKIYSNVGFGTKMVLQET